MADNYQMEELFPYFKGKNSNLRLMNTRMGNQDLPRYKPDTVDGIVDTNSAEQKELLKEYRMLSEDDGESVTVYQSSSSVHHYMLSRAEKVPEGEPEMWEYFPVITEQLQMDKPMDGVQPFNFNYRVDGSNKPMIMYIVKEVE